MKTKIICTIGPSTYSYDMLKALAKAGMNCARLNFSHGSYEEHGDIIRRIRKVSKELNKEIAIMQDLPGPKMRIGKVKNNSIYLQKGSIVRLTREDIIGNEQRIPITYDLSKFVRDGADIFLADGSIKLKVVEIKDDIICSVEIGGKLISGKGINIPDLNDDFEILTDADKDHLKFGEENDIDLVAVSFVRDAKDVIKVRKFTDNFIISKIERRDAVNNLDSIIDVSDGIIIARGDLGIEMPLERVPLLQRSIIASCNKVGIPVITATQILESMIINPRPTRAEVTDIAEAILNGTDALMLSEETAIGNYPIECVNILRKVATVTEDALEQRKDMLVDDIHNASSKAIEQIAKDIDAKLILVTNSLRLAQKISRFKPRAPIVLLSNDIKIDRMADISWGIFPIMVEKNEPREMINVSSNKLIGEGYVRANDPMVIAYEINDDIFICITKFANKK